MTPNIRDEINGFMQQVDNLQRNFNTRNILRICANNEVSDSYLRALEHDYCNYKAWDIVMLTDDSPDPRQCPMRKNIIDGMKWLVNNAQSGDMLLFFYARSGRQVSCTKGGSKVEVDMKKPFYQSIYDQDGHIIYGEMYYTMIKPLPTSCRLTVRYLLVAFSFKRIDNSPFTRFYFLAVILRELWQKGMLLLLPNWGCQPHGDGMHAAHQDLESTV
ncbi:hypothetical protein EDD85DRAFT_948108 [Armillaria nabsnona]|nr:hypothetical protein EDD85DRAFT_948108 [Armillaria nabsnona]